MPLRYPPSKQASQHSTQPWAEHVSSHYCTALLIFASLYTLLGLHVFLRE